MPDQNANWDHRLEFAALTDTGMRRANNQDSHAVVPAADLQAWRERGHFFMVADGMGAHAAGELASKLTVDGVAHLYGKYTEMSPPESLEKALVETNTEVHRRGQANSDFRNMGTTASVLVLLPQGALIAHIGDSRIYRLRDNVLQQLTFDHSLVWELRKAGQLSEDNEAIPKNVITRSVGPNASVQVDIEGPFPVRAGDVFLLCSDGLTGKIEDRELAAILANLSATNAGHLLIDIANLRGGPDNITVIVTRIVGEEMASDAVETEPLKVGKQKTNRSVRPVVWLAAAVLLLIALVLAITSRLLAAAVIAGFVCVCLLVDLIVNSRRSSSGTLLVDGRRLGRGPYAEANCPSESETVDLLSTIVREVRSKDNRSFSIDWTRFDELGTSAAENQKSGRLSGAISDYSGAIRALMKEVHEERHRQASDSAIDL